MMSGEYLIVRNSAKDLTYWKNAWLFPHGSERFKSLRQARVYIKKNVGRLNITIIHRLPGVIRNIQVEGTFAL